MSVEIEIPSDDCLPHEKAVWRSGSVECVAPGRVRLSIQYASGAIVHTWVRAAKWAGCLRWRFGWPPFEERK